MTVSFLLSVANEPTMPSVVIQNVIVLDVVMLSVVALTGKPCKGKTLLLILASSKVKEKKALITMALPPML